MPLDGEPRILGIHAAAVVFDAQRLLAAELDRHRNTRRPGIERVLDQLFYNRRRTLHHLARSDLVGQVWRKDFDEHGGGNAECRMLNAEVNAEGLGLKAEH